MGWPWKIPSAYPNTIATAGAVQTTLQVAGVGPQPALGFNVGTDGDGNPYAAPATRYMRLLGSGTGVVVAANGQLADVDCTTVSELLLLVQVTAITGTSTPGIQFALTAKDGAGQYYPLWTPSFITATGKTAYQMGPGQYNNPLTQALVIPATAAFSTTVQGTTPSITFNWYLYGR